MKKLNSSYWDERHLKGETGWDLKQVSPPLKAYFDAPWQSMGRILIPGCGMAYEARYLWEQGKKDVTIMDFAPSLVTVLKQNFSDTTVKVICGDIFEHRGAYDTIVEQTLFCAIDPMHRLRYVNQIADLLHENGVWFGLLFNREFDNEGPPFGGNESEYRELFSNRFDIIAMEKCENSIAPRLGSELFFIAKKKKLKE
jgi:methyl halide transferase